MIPPSSGARLIFPLREAVAGDFPKPEIYRAYTVGFFLLTLRDELHMSTLYPVEKRHEQENIHAHGYLIRER